MNSEKETSIKKLQKKLYAKQPIIDTHDRKRFSSLQTNVSTDWSDEDIPKDIPQQEDVKRPKKKITGFTVLLLGSFVFFLISLLIALFIFSNGQNQVEYNRVDLSVLGPNSIAGGEPLTFDVMIANDNQVDIIKTDIIVDYPQGSYSTENESGIATQDIRQVEQVVAGTQDSQKFSVILFGQEGETKDIKISYEYRVPGSNVILYKERIYQVKLDSAPISIDVQHPTESLSGEIIEFSFTIISNSNKVIENLYAIIEYPFGFEVVESDPEPEVYKNDLFSIGDLGAGESRSVRIIGRISGQDSEQRVFKYRVGLINKDTSEMNFVIANSDSVVTIQRPPVKLAVTVNNKEGSVHKVQTDSNARLMVQITNNLPTQIADVKIIGTLLGQGFERRGIRTDGFYDTNTNKILWQKTDIPELGLIEAGKTIDVEMSIPIVSSDTLAGIVTDPSITMNITAEGITFDFENQQKRISVNQDILLKIPTSVELESLVLHSTGPFETSGPMRPTVGVRSEYNILWRVKNTTSIIRDTKVTGVLPPYVDFVQAEQVEGSTLTYDPRTRVVTWDIQEISAGAAYTKSAPQIGFKIAVIPSLPQTNNELVLIQDKLLSTLDSFIKESIKLPNIKDDTTRGLEKDPKYTGTETRVQEESAP